MALKWLLGSDCLEDNASFCINFRQLGGCLSPAIWEIVHQEKNNFSSIFQTCDISKACAKREKIMFLIEILFTAFLHYPLYEAAEKIFNSKS